MQLAVLHTRLHMALWTAIALAWVVLGANSQNVPFSTSTFWIIVTSLTAGAALGVARRGSRDSMLVYLIAALAVGSCRSIAYLLNSAGGPAWVWLIVTLTNVVLLVRWNDDV